MFRGETICKGIFVCCLTVVLSMTAGASDIQQNEQKKQELQEQKQQIQQEAQELETQLDAILNEMRATGQAMEKKEADIAQAEEELVTAKLSERAQAERMQTRIRYLYENGSISLLEVLINSENLADFVSKAEYVSMVSAYDNRMLTDYKKTVKKVEKKEAGLQEDYEKLGTLQAQLTEKQKKVESLAAQANTKLAGLNEQISDLDSLISSAKAAEKRRKEAEAAKQEAQNQTASSNQTTNKVTITGNGRFTHPCPGMSYQSSYFGEVRKGIGDTRPHKGNDYAAPSGTPVYAAAAGTVIIAGYSNSAGNWVVIDHGNGLTTKYMHMCSYPYVSAGQKVVKGQQIGGVGTTGQSTGNHLHFQVEENGVAVSPDKYL